MMPLSTVTRNKVQRQCLGRFNGATWTTPATKGLPRRPGMSVRTKHPNKTDTNNPMRQRDTLTSRYANTRYIYLRSTFDTVLPNLPRLIKIAATSVSWICPLFDFTGTGLRRSTVSLFFHLTLHRGVIYSISASQSLISSLLCDSL